MKSPTPTPTPTPIHHGTRAKILRMWRYGYHNWAIARECGLTTGQTFDVLESAGVKHCTIVARERRLIQRERRERREQRANTPTPKEQDR